MEELPENCYLFFSNAEVEISVTYFFFFENFKLIAHFASFMLSLTFRADLPLKRALLLKILYISFIRNQVPISESNT